MFKNFYTTFNIGPIPIQVWGFFVALGMLLTFIIIWKRGKSLGYDIERILDLSVWMVVSGLIGSRFFHVFFYEPVYFLENPIDIVKFWQGGMSSFGGVAGAILAFFLFKRKNNFLREKLLAIVDLIAFSALYGWMLGRVGCVLIHDHLGRVYKSFLSIQTSAGPRLDMAALEIVGLIPLAIIFYLSRNKKRQDGWYFYTLFIYYGILRFVLDFFRAIDIEHADARYFGLTPGQYFGIVLMLIGIVLMNKKRSKDTRYKQFPN